MEKIKIVLVEDQDLVLRGVSSILNQNKGFQVVKEIKDIENVLSLNVNFDLLLSDVCTENGHTSLDYIKQIKEKFPNIRIVLMTSVMEVSFIDRAKELGVDSFVYKTIDATDLISVIINTMRGYTTFPTNPRDTLPEFKHLTEIELNIVRLFCQGNDRKTIAINLNYSESTIKSHITNILEKTGFDSMIKLCFFATKNGYIV